MNFLSLITFIFTAFFLVFDVPCAQSINLKQVKCLVCRAIVDEFKHQVDKIDPDSEMEIGQYKLDYKGNAVQKKVPLALSEVHLSDMLDTICKSMDDYVRATYKSNGKLTLMKLIVDGGMNPLMNEVDIVQDGDLNKSLEYFCSEVVNEYEEAFIEVISKKEKNAKAKICIKEADYCRDFFDESEDDDAELNDEYESDKTEL